MWNEIQNLLVVTLFTLLAVYTWVKLAMYVTNSLETWEQRQQRLLIENGEHSCNDAGYLAERL